MNATNATYTVEIITLNKGEHYTHRFRGAWALYQTIQVVHQVKKWVTQPVIVMVSKNGILHTAFNSKGN